MDGTSKGIGGITVASGEGFASSPGNMGWMPAIGRPDFAQRLYRTGFTVNALISPGQNRATDNSNLAAGEGDCAGGNIQGGGGTPVAGTDGAYGTAYSVSAAYRAGGLYVTGAYELHKAVNRTSDLGAFDPNDIANETAAKLGAQYKFATGTTVSAIYEDLKRNVPAHLSYQNERSHKGYSLAVSQDLTAKDSVHLGWAHAGQTPGDPGTHIPLAA